MDRIEALNPAVTRGAMDWVPEEVASQPNPEISETYGASSELFPEPPRSLPSSKVQSVPSHTPQPFVNSFETTGQADALRAHPSSPTTLPSPRARRSQSLAHHSSAGVTRGPIRRKPLSSTASPVATRYSSQSDHLDTVARLNHRPEQRFSRAFSLDSPTLYEFPETEEPIEPAPLDVRVVNAVRALSAVSGSSRSSFASTNFSSPRRSQHSSPASPSLSESEENLDSNTGESDLRDIPNIAPAAPPTVHIGSQDEVLSVEAPVVTTQEFDFGAYEDTRPETPVGPNNNSNVVSRSLSTRSTRKQAPPHLTLAQADTNVRSATAGRNNDRLDTNLNKPLPNRPTSDLRTFFGWSYSPSSTEFSDKEDGVSTLPSPVSTKPTTAYTSAFPFTDEYPGSAKSLDTTTTIHASNQNAIDYCEAYLHTPSISTTAPTGQIEEMEDELKDISMELAASIRREMDLEDLVERLQDQLNNPQAPGKRSSDYYSDSGYSSAKLSDYEQAKEEVSHVQRRAEQEKAQIRLELTGKLQEERTIRRELDQQIQELSKKASQLQATGIRASGVTLRVKELEAQCEDLRRKVAEERQFKENFEDLFTALKGELQNASNERDNLRDEIVPSLRARVEGLEAEAADQAKMAYDTTKIQQELQLLKSENAELKMSAFAPAPVPAAAPRAAAGLTRSASIASTGSFKKGRPFSLARSNTVKQSEPREVLAERLKDVEAQRDALHSALKSLLDRQEFQNRENEKKIKVLEQERERLLTESPKKAGYEKDIMNLRDEISVLRRRAEEAIEQKWRVEKGLAGLKMDLDRAEEEVTSLRGLLKEKDVLIPDNFARARSSFDPSAIPVTSESLERAYKDLQDAYTEALERIKALENSSSSDEKTRLAIDRLEQALSIAVSERDLARSEAESLRSRVDSLQMSERTHLGTERELADQLRETARRVEELAQQVRTQLATNSTLRTRLTEAVTRGEADQRANKNRIAALQSQLSKLEMQLVTTQTAAEERVQRHEDELQKLKEAHNTQLQRLRDASGGLRSPRPFSPKSPYSPKFPLSPRFPVRPGSSGSAMLSPGMAERSDARRSMASNGSSSQPSPGDGGDLRQVENLRARVAELESALSLADAEMQEVVSRMNTAQIEVLNLQEEREEAVRETRRLQKLMEQEKVRAFEDRFANLGSTGK